MNEVLFFALVAVGIFAAIVAHDVRAAKWLASVIYARALALEASREMYSVARRSGLNLGTRIEGLKVLESKPERVALLSGEQVG